MSKKIIIISIVLAVVIISGLAFYFWNINKPVAKTAGSVLKDNSPEQTITPPAVIILSSLKEKVLTGEVFSVSINLSSRTPSDGTDIIILYDPTLLSVEATSEKVVKVGTIYPEYPINNDDKKGRIVVSGISSQPQGTLASGLFGVVNFKALKKGKATISLDFTKGSTTDSNVIETKSSSDILEAVQNLEVLID